ncbi:hypothetical protein INT43_001431 [Umbelopsis isabellina]|uniref:Uncharacterized protein n=1 Tax=Mortierella isabellina TaxID=91625 RepID=A0A8H7PE21_MORIS|nr:hypothetical protein INT43_001431 [Umbelopsis isabellina]
MEKSLDDYDKSLEALDKEKEKLEMLMRRMGQEWAESGAGIGWMGSLDGLTSPAEQSTTDTSPDLDGNSEFLISPPISDYVQSLLNANQQAQISINDATVLESSQPLTEIIAPPMSTTKRSSLIVKTPFKLSDSPPPPKN